MEMDLRQHTHMVMGVTILVPLVDTVQVMVCRPPHIRWAWVEAMEILMGLQVGTRIQHGRQVGRLMFQAVHLRAGMELGAS
jgi:hypothetical protein